MDGLTLRIKCIGCRCVHYLGKFFELLSSNLLEGRKPHVTFFEHPYRLILLMAC